MNIIYVNECAGVIDWDRNSLGPSSATANYQAACTLSEKPVHSLWAPSILIPFTFIAKQSKYKTLIPSEKPVHSFWTLEYSHYAHFCKFLVLMWPRRFTHNKSCLQCSSVNSFLRSGCSCPIFSHSFLLFAPATFVTGRELMSLFVFPFGTYAA